MAQDEGVIDDAGPWKLELQRLGQDLQTHFTEPDLFPGNDLDTETQQIFLVERLAFVTALTLRKLAEAGKVSVQFLSTSIEYERRTIRDPTRAPDQLNMHRALDFYNEGGTTRRVSYGGFANLLIHSKAFLTLSDFDDLDQEIPFGFGVTSDRTHLSHLSIFSVDEVQKLVHALAEDDVVEKTLIRDGRGGWISIGSNKRMGVEQLQAYLERSPYKETTAEIRQFVADRYGWPAPPTSPRSS